VSEALLKKENEKWRSECEELKLEMKALRIADKEKEISIENLKTQLELERSRRAHCEVLEKVAKSEETNAAGDGELHKNTLKMIDKLTQENVSHQLIMISAKPLTPLDLHRTAWLKSAKKLRRSS
jgi:hypothetical protein